MWLLTLVLKDVSNFPMLNEKLMHVLCECVLSMNWKALSEQKTAFSFYIQISLGYSDEMEESLADSLFSPQ